MIMVMMRWVASKQSLNGVVKNEPRMDDGNSRTAHRSELLTTSDRATLLNATSSFKPLYTSVATESWSGLNSFPLGKYRYKLFIERLSKGVFNILVRLVG